MYNVILVRYGEMTLKKANYKMFLSEMNKQIINRLSIFKGLNFYNTNYRFYIELNDNSYQEVSKELSKIFGIHSYSLCVKVKPNYEEIIKAAIALIEKEKPNKEITFKVETHRADKDFPDTSLEISKKVASSVLKNVNNLKVDVHNPELLLTIDFRKEGAFLFTSNIKAQGGYPLYSGGRGLLMLSGGIDSPVAGFLALRKGIELEALHFEAPPYTNKLALQKVIDLTKKLAVFTHPYKIKLNIVNFTEIQKEIYEKADKSYLVTLMRRAMYKIASLYAKENNIQALITGESIGQVASQTLESMNVINDVTNIPVIRPLAVFDKEEIIKISKEIETYDISIKPYEDCCTIFIPIHPIIKPRLNNVLIEEEKCSLDNLIKNAFKNITQIEIDSVVDINAFFEEEKFEL
ncbi:MAG: tRNA uracil 4-sulfurtransferase ThiI [Bacilli bacterium]